VHVFRWLWWSIRGLCVSQAALAAENLALRQQLAIYERARPCPRLKLRDRLFWVMLSRWWSGWRSALVIVQPATVCRWHRAGFRLFWRWKSRGGRPRINRELRELIRRLAAENPLWGVPRIRAELKLLGYRIAAATIAKYLPSLPPGRKRKSSGSWSAFWKNHTAEKAAIDFFVVPTATFRLLYVFLVLSPDRRRVLHFNVTANPSAQWTAQQLTEACPFDSAPRYLVRDNDPIYGRIFRDRLEALGIEDTPIAPRSPWQNPYVERLIGTLRRELLDHVIVLNERHLKRLVAEFLVYYHAARPHQSLDDNSPIPREVEPPERGPIVRTPLVGGLHHRYGRRAA
jgi:transposase InsO family protein